MDIKRLYYFCTIIEHGQISKAAKTLNMSQPPLSQRLKELEDELGVTLIIRDRKRWWVTEYGHELYRRSKAILNQLEGITENFSYSIGDVIGELQIGTTQHCLSYVTTVLADISQLYPLISYDVNVVEKHTLESMLQNRQLDMGVAPLPIQATSCDITYLENRYIIAVAPKNFLEYPHDTILQVEHLVNIPLMLPSPNASQTICTLVKKAFQATGHNPYIMVTSSDIYAQITLLRKGIQAVAIIPHTELPHDLDSFDIYRMHVPDYDSKVALYCLHNTEYSRITQIVRDAFVKTFVS